MEECQTSIEPQTIKEQHCECNVKFCYWMNRWFEIRKIRWHSKLRFVCLFRNHSGSHTLLASPRTPTKLCCCISKSGSTGKWSWGVSRAHLGLQITSRVPQPLQLHQQIPNSRMSLSLLWQHLHIKRAAEKDASGDGSPTLSDALPNPTKPSSVWQMLVFIWKGYITQPSGI